MGKIRDKIGDTVSEARENISNALSDNKRNVVIAIVGAVVIFGMLSYHALTNNEEEVVKEAVITELNEDEDSEAMEYVKEPTEEDDYEKMSATAWIHKGKNENYYMIFEPKDYDLGKQNVHMYIEYPDKPLKEGRYADDAYYTIKLSDGTMTGTSYEYGDIYKEYYFDDGKLYIDEEEYEPYNVDNLIHISYGYGTGEDQKILDHGTSPEQNE